MMTDKTLKCDPGSAWIFESQCATKHRIKISSEEGSDGITRILVRLKATDTSGTFSSKYSTGGMGHSVAIDIRYTPPAEDGGESRNLVTGETLAYTVPEDGWVQATFDAIQPGTYNVTVNSRAGDDCCTPKGSANHTVRVDRPAQTSNQDSIAGGSTPVSTPNPVVIGLLAVGGLVAIGLAFMGGE